MSYIKVPFIEVKQPIGEFYIASISHKDLLDISFVDRRRIESDGDTILGIQRGLSSNRVKELRQYVNHLDATFPTGIILSINSLKYLNVDDPESIEVAAEKIVKIEDGFMHIFKEGSVAKVIDGQHRLAGLEGYNQSEPFDLNVTIFIDMDPEDEAMVFSTINKSQTKVNKSLVYDLFDLAKTRSPQKTAHNIARLLNKMEDSPFHKKIKLLGFANEIGETISQATFVESILSFISTNALKDRDDLMRKKKLDSSEGLLKKHPFRSYFIEGKDAIIAKNLSNYFEAVREKWGDAWNAKAPNMILNRTTGFLALMRFLKHSYSGLEKVDDIVPKEEFATIFNKIKLYPDDFSKERYKPGGAGIALLFKDLVAGEKTI